MVSRALSGVQMRPRTNSGHSLSRFSVPLLKGIRSSTVSCRVVRNSTERMVSLAAGQCRSSAIAHKCTFVRPLVAARSCSIGGQDRGDFLSAFRILDADVNETRRRDLGCDAVATVGKVKPLEPRLGSMVFPRKSGRGERS